MAEQLQCRNPLCGGYKVSTETIRINPETGEKYTSQTQGPVFLFCVFVVGTIWMAILLIGSIWSIIRRGFDMSPFVFGVVGIVGTAISYYLTTSPGRSPRNGLGCVLGIWGR